MSVLKEIWKEMYAHRENPPQPDSDASFLAGLLAYYEKIMEKEFSGVQMALFKGYCHFDQKLIQCREQEAFQEGFRLAMRIWEEALREPEENLNEDAEL